jgi:poly(3-hydroxybutyrate) depolymerase
MTLSWALMASAGTWETRNRNGLQYHIFLPENLRSLNQVSLMLNLHGCAQQSDDLVKYGNWERAADQFSTVVVIPQVPKGGALFGCWDYYGSDHTDRNHDHGQLIDLITELLKDPKLKIDSRHVFVSGISSGAAEALLLGCLRPDIFSGIGLNSSPAVPSGSGDIAHPPIDGGGMASFCNQIAGVYKNALATQKISVLTSDQDYTVSPLHSKVIVDAFVLMDSLQSSPQKMDLNLLEGNNKAGEGLLYLNKNGKAQMSFITNKGMGHNWAAGSSSGAPGQGPFITQNSINYPLYLLQFLADPL